MADPVSVMVDTFDTEKIPVEKIEQLVIEHFRMKPAEIIEELDLLKPIYRNTATYGHFGRNSKEFKWELVNKADLLRDAAGLKA